MARVAHMPALVIPSGAQMTLQWSRGAHRMYNVLGLFANAGFVIDQNTATALATVVSSAFTAAAVGPHVDVNTILSQVGVRDLRTANQAEYVAAPSGCLGAGLVEATAASIALCVTLRTAKAGKRYRGRVYLPFNTESSFDGETSSFTTPAGTAGSGFIGNIKTGLVTAPGIAGSLQLAVLSRGGDEDPPVTAATPVTTIMVRSLVATSQRRRLPHRG
jgi:hypothetical protein